MLLLCALFEPLPPADEYFGFICSSITKLRNQAQPVPVIIGRTLDEYTELLSTDSKSPIHFGAAGLKLQASVTLWAA